MANGTTLRALIAGAGLWLMALAAPLAALAGGIGCGCTPPPPPAPPSSPCCAPAQNIVVPGVNVFVAPSVNVNVSAQTTASAVANVRAQGATFIGGGGSASMIGPGAVSVVNLNTGGADRQAYEATRTRMEKVVIQAFCFDDKEVPHPASQVSPDQNVEEMYDGEVYRCIAGTHMQITIAPWAEHISFEGGRTITCHKGEALYHAPGHGGGRLECRPQIPARDCNERSLLRRFGAGIKILTMMITERYTAYREEQHTSSTMMSLDGGVGGVVY